MKKEAQLLILSMVLGLGGLGVQQIGFHQERTTLRDLRVAIAENRENDFQPLAERARTAHDRVPLFVFGGCFVSLCGSSLASRPEDER